MDNFKRRYIEMRAYGFSESYTFGSCCAAACTSVRLDSLLDTAILLVVSICVVVLRIIVGSFV